MNQELQLKNELEKERKRILSKNRKCLHLGCEENAIQAHVFQGKKILKNIVDSTNHFYCIEQKGVFDDDREGLLKIKRLGIKEGYKFPGFCYKHDDQIFAPIEKQSIDFENWKHLALITYRTVCLELRLKEMYLELNEAICAIVKKNIPNQLHYIDLNPAKKGVNDLQFYKLEFEYEMAFSHPVNFSFKFHKLPQRRICFSSPQTIEDENNEYSWEEDRYGLPTKTPLATTILNFFPFREDSYFILCTHNKYKCFWGDELFRKLENIEDYDKILSDLITYRLDFWAIAPEIFENISKSKIKEFIKESSTYAERFDYKIDTKFNLFS